MKSLREMRAFHSPLFFASSLGFVFKREKFLLKRGPYKKVMKSYFSPTSICANGSAPLSGRLSSPLGLNPLRRQMSKSLSFFPTLLRISSSYSGYIFFNFSEKRGLFTAGIAPNGKSLDAIPTLTFLTNVKNWSIFPCLLFCATFFSKLIPPLVFEYSKTL